MVGALSVPAIVLRQRFSIGGPPLVVHCESRNELKHLRCSNRIAARIPARCVFTVHVRTRFVVWNTSSRIVSQNGANQNENPGQHVASSCKCCHQLSIRWYVLDPVVLLLVLIEFPPEMQDLIMQKCLPKADMGNITIKCNTNEMIAIKAAFFTSSVVDQCPFSYINRSNQVDSNMIDNKPMFKLSCTDDLRMTLNSR